jgi:hypothetical protein
MLYISATLGERMNSENFNSVKMLSSGNRQFTFSTQKVNTYEKCIIIYYTSLHINIFYCYCRKRNTRKLT